MGDRSWGWEFGDGGWELGDGGSELGNQSLGVGG